MIGAPAAWRFRPRLGASLAAGLAILVLLGLGTWQLQRLAWKGDLIAQRQARLAEPAVAPPAGWRADAWSGRRVLLDGAFLARRGLWVGPTSRDRRPGYRLFAAFGAADGRVFWVERGFAASDRRPEAELQEAAPARLEAVLRAGGWSGPDWLRPGNRPAAEEWVWLDLAAMAAARDLPAPVETGHFLIETGGAERPAGLAPSPLGTDLPNNHLGYALTWYGIALTLAGVFLAFSLERRSGA